MQLSKRVRRRNRGIARELIKCSKLFYREPSCATCKYAYWTKWFDGETRDVDIDCNYPDTGDLGTYKQRMESEIIYYWHHDLTDHPEDCGTFNLVD